MKGKPSILTVGDINLDIIAPIPFYPQKGGEGVTNRAEIHLGGSATNTAVLLARSGFKTYLLGRIGEDPFGDYALRLLSHTGIDMSLIQRDQNLTTGIMFIVVTPDGERTIFGQRGANVNLEPISLKGTQFATLSWVHVSGYSFLQEPQRSTAMKILEEASALG
jgi:ribokinase